MSNISLTAMNAIEDRGFFYSPAYLAGLVDADGNIYCANNGNYRFIRISITQLYPNLLIALRGRLGVGSINKCTQSQAWTMEITGKQAENLLNDFNKFLVLKSHQAILALKWARGSFEGGRAQLTEANSFARHQGIIEENINFEWLGGFFDGDGCISIKGATPKLQLELQTTIHGRDAVLAHALVKKFGGRVGEKLDQNVRWDANLKAETFFELLKTTNLKYFQLKTALDYLEKFPLHKRANAEESQFTKELITTLKKVEVVFPFGFNDPDIYQLWTRTTALQASDSIEYLTLGLASEAGEVAGVIKKIIRDKNGEIDDEMREKLVSEIADCVWYIARLCDMLDVKFSKLLADNMSKLESRLQRNALGGSGDNR